MAQKVGMICEQGDMGLFYDPLSEADQKTYDKQQSKEKNNNKGHNNSASKEQDE